MKVLKYILVLGIGIFLSSCGISKSLKHLPEQLPLEKNFPSVVKQSDTAFFFG